MHPWPIEKAAMTVSERAARAVFWGRTWRRYDAHGWPRSDLMTESISMTV